MDFEIGQKKVFNISINISSIEKKSELRLSKLTKLFVYFICVFDIF